MMALVLGSIILLFTLFVLTRGDYDRDFCKTKLADIEIDWPPVNWSLNLPYDGMFLSELKTQNNISVVNVHYYSHSLTLIKSVSTTATGTTFYYTDASFGDQEAFSNSTCSVETPTYWNDFKHSLRKQDDGTYLIGLANQMVEWLSSTTVKVKYRIFTEYSTYRGIPASRWFTCNYDIVHDKTAVIEWMITDYRNISVVDYTFPMVPLYKKSTYSDNTTDETDYSLAERIPSTNLKNIMARPTKTWCKNEKGHKPLPRMPKYLAWTVEQRYVDDESGQTMLTFGREIYDFDNGIYFSYDIEPTEDEIGKGEDFKEIEVFDFNTGVSFYIDQVAANCSIQKMYSWETSPTASSAGFIKMQQPKQFFYLDSSTYKYSGVRIVRGFECDTWIGRLDEDEDDASTYVWSFMTTAQMIRLGYPVDAWQVPVSLDIYGDYEEESVFINIFNYNTVRREAELPVNVGLCYGFQNTTTVKMIIDGRYDNIIQHNGFNSFKRAFLTSVQKMGDIGTPLRISDIEVYANQENENETVAQFRLLPRAAAPGNVFGGDKDTLETDKVLKMLRGNIDNGYFFVGVSYPDSNYKQLEAKRGTMEVDDSSRSVNKTGVSSAPTSTIKGYSVGSMVGFAFGMLILGLSIGAGTVYGFKRYRNSRAIDSQFSMRNLEEKVG